MKRSDFRFFDRLRVRWAEVDMQRIVFNGHYLMYFDTAIAAYWRAMALPYHETMEHLGGDLFVRKAVVEYLGSARYDEVCDVALRCGRVGTSSMQFVTALFRGDTLLVHGELVYVFADPATQTSRPVPPALRDALEAFERGDAMTESTLGPWSTLAADAHPLRRAAFVAEQRLGEALVEDEADAAALHVLARNRFGMPVATGRLVVGRDGAGQIGRMAVHAGARGQGLGRTVLRALVDAARERGCTRLRLDALSAVAAFYVREGFVPEGAPFEAAGVSHQTFGMALPVSTPAT